MDGNVLGVLGIPLDLIFEGGLDTEIQTGVVQRIEERTPFRVKEEGSLESLMSEAAEDLSSTMHSMASALARGTFGQGFEFMDPVDVFICLEKISVDEMPRHCVSMDEVMGEEVEKVFGRIIEAEAWKRTEKQSNRWSLRSLSDIFKSDPASDKTVGDGLFLSGRYREAYKIYSKYRGTDEFSCYCVEMSVYCLLLARKPIPQEMIRLLEQFGTGCKVYVTRLMAVIIASRECLLALRTLPRIQTGPLFRALAQEDLALSLEDRRWDRKRTGIIFESAVILHREGYIGRSMRCYERFLALTKQMIDSNRFLGATQDVLSYSSRFVRGILRSVEGEGLESRAESRNVSQHMKEAIEVLRRHGRSTSDFKGAVNTVESVVLECGRPGLVRIMSMGDGSSKVYRIGQAIQFDASGRFVIESISFGERGIEESAEVGVTLDVGEDVLFMHVETDDVCEVLCGELYFLRCQVFKNHSSRIKVFFGGKEFATDCQAFGLEVLFPSTGVYDKRLVLEACGITTYKDIRFVALPSFSIDIFNYRHCLPLLFLKVQSHVASSCTMKPYAMGSGGFDVCGVDAVRSSDSYKRYAIEYFGRRIVGANGYSINELRTPKDEIQPEDFQGVLCSMERSSPIVTDLLFGDLISTMKDEIEIPGKSIFSACVFLRVKTTLQSLVSAKEGSHGNEDTKMQSVDEALMQIMQSRCRLRSQKKVPEAGTSALLSHTIPIKVEVEISRTRRCVFMVEGMFATSVRRPCGELDRKGRGPLGPFIYMTHLAPIRTNEPTVVYLCISNYYEDRTVTARLSSSTMVICREDAVVVAKELSASFFEIRSVFKEKKKYEGSDIEMRIEAGGEEIGYESFVELPLVL